MSNTLLVKKDISSPHLALASWPKQDNGFSLVRDRGTPTSVILKRVKEKYVQEETISIDFKKELGDILDDQSENKQLPKRIKADMPLASDLTEEGNSKLGIHGAIYAFRSLRHVMQYK